MRDLPIQVAAGSELANLLSRLEAAEAEADTQRQIVTAARDTYQEAEHAQRRSSYLPSQLGRPAEDLDAEHAAVTALLSAREFEEQRFTPMVARWRELRDRFNRDYDEFLKLRRQFDDLQRLAG